MTEKQVQDAIVKKLRDAGWYVRVTSQDKSTRKALSGEPDVRAYKNDHTLLVECKAPGGELRPSQIEFKREINRHEGPHLHHIVAYYSSDIDHWLAWAD